MDGRGTLNARNLRVAQRENIFRNNEEEEKKFE